MKYVVTILAIVICCVQSNGQSDSTSQKDMRHLFGFSFGLTSTKLSGNELDFMLDNYPVSSKNAHQESKTGIDLGFHYQYMLTKNYFIKSGLAIVSKKNELKGSAFPMNTTFTFLSLPALAGIDLGGGKEGKLSLLIETGFIANLTVGSSYETSHWTSTVTTNVKTLVPSYTAGTSISFKAKNQYRFFFAYRFCKDLTDVYERVHDYENTDGERVVKKYNLRLTSNHFSIGLFLPAKSKFIN